MSSIYLVMNDWGGQFINAAVAQSMKVDIVEGKDDFMPITMNDIESDWAYAADAQFESFTVFQGEENEALREISDTGEDFLLKDSLCISELMLRCSEAIILKHGYISEREFVNTGKTSTAMLLDSLHRKIKGGSSAYEILTDEEIMGLEGSHDNYLQRKCLWLLDLLERQDGSSNFTKQSFYSLKYGYFNAKVFAWWVNHLIQDSKRTKGHSMPTKPFLLKPDDDSMQDLPGMFSVCRVRYYRGFYDKKAFVVAASKDSGLGVCFDLNFYKAKNMGISEGDVISIRGKPSGVDGEKFLKIKNVKVKR